MNTETIQLIISIAGVALSALSAFWGVKIGLTRVEAKIEAHRGEIDDLKGRVHRLEDGYFHRGK